jgi:hypothetical protein
MVKITFIYRQIQTHLLLVSNCWRLQCKRSLNIRKISIICNQNQVLIVLKPILKYLIFLFFRISIFKSSGFIDHWINTEYRKILNINLVDFDFSEVVKQEYDILNLYQLQSTLYLLIFGNLLALFSLFYEFIIKFYYHYIKQIHS